MGMVFSVARKESAFYHVPPRAVRSIWVNKFVEFSNLNDISQVRPGNSLLVVEVTFATHLSDYM